MMPNWQLPATGDGGGGIKGEAGVEAEEDAFIMQTRNVFAVVLH